MRMIIVEGNFNYARYCKLRKTLEHSHRMTGKKRPKHWLRRPTQMEMLASAKRFARDGEVRNAVAMLRLAFPEAKINVK